MLSVLIEIWAPLCVLSKAEGQLFIKRIRENTVSKLYYILWKFEEFDSPYGAHPCCQCLWIIFYILQLGQLPTQDKSTTRYEITSWVDTRETTRKSQRIRQYSIKSYNNPYARMPSSLLLVFLGLRAFSSCAAFGFFSVTTMYQTHHDLPQESSLFLRVSFGTRVLSKALPSGALAAVSFMSEEGAIETLWCTFYDQTTY